MEYLGDGTTVSFPVPFVFDSLKVTVDDVETQDFTVSSNFLVFSKPPAPNVRITITTDGGLDRNDPSPGKMVSRTASTFPYRVSPLQQSSSYEPLKFISDGVTKTYSVTFGAISSDHIRVFVNGEPFNDYWFPSPGQLMFNTVPPKGSVVSIVRITPDTRLVDFQNTSMLNESILDLDSNQLLFLIQEAHHKARNALPLDYDDHYNAGGRRIKNIGLPVDDNDAVNKAFADDVLARAEDSASRAKQSELNARESVELAGEYAFEAAMQADRAESEANIAQEAVHEALSSISRAENALAEVLRVIDDFQFVVDGGFFITGIDGGRFIRGDEIILSGGVFVRDESELIFDAGTFDPVEGGVVG